MSDAFCDVTALLDRGVTIPDDQIDATQVLLDDASTYLRGVIGNQVWPAATSTITLWAQPGWSWVDIPLVPLISVNSVVVTPTDPWLLQYLPPMGVLVERFDQSIRVCGPAKVTVGVTHGFTDPPLELVTWTCVIAAQVLNSLQQLNTFGSGGVTSLAMEDYKIMYSADDSSFALPPRVEESLRERFGGGLRVTESWR